MKIVLQHLTKKFPARGPVRGRKNRELAPCRQKRRGRDRVRRGRSEGLRRSRRRADEQPAVSAADVRAQQLHAPLAEAAGKSLFRRAPAHALQPRHGRAGTARRPLLRLALCARGVHAAPFRLRRGRSRQRRAVLPHPRRGRAAERLLRGPPRRIRADHLHLLLERRPRHLLLHDLHQPPHFGGGAAPRGPRRRRAHPLPDAHAGGHFLSERPRHRVLAPPPAAPPSPGDFVTFLTMWDDSDKGTGQI